MICPAYQSAFIYNDSIRDRLFAYFDEDSLPAIVPFSSKNKYGIIEKVSERKRLNSLQIVRMEKIFPGEDPTRDSLLLALGETQGENLNVDSLVNAHLEAQYHYNVEQETYMQLFGEYLYRPPPPEPDSENTENSEEVPEENMTRKERRQARREAKAQEKEKREQEEADAAQEEENQGDF